MLYMWIVEKENCQEIWLLNIYDNQINNVPYYFKAVIKQNMTD